MTWEITANHERANGAHRRSPTGAPPTPMGRQSSPRRPASGRPSTGLVRAQARAPADRLMLLKGNRIVYETSVMASRGTATYVVALNADQVIQLETLCERLGLKSWQHQNGLVVATGRAGAARINAAAARQGITLAELRPWSPVLAMIEAAGTS